MDDMEKQILRTRKLNHCERLLNDIKNQLQQNEETFSRAMSGEFQEIYRETNHKAAEHCAQLKQRLTTLKQEEVRQSS